MYRVHVVCLVPMASRVVEALEGSQETTESWETQVPLVPLARKEL